MEEEKLYHIIYGPAITRLHGLTKDQLIQALKDLRKDAIKYPANYKTVVVEGACIPFSKGHLKHILFPDGTSAPIYDIDPSDSEPDFSGDLVDPLLPDEPEPTAEITEDRPAFDEYDEPELVEDEDYFD